MEEQLYAKVDLTGNQPFMDTLMLTARRPWYSMDYDELITGASQTPWGMAATEPYHFAAQIGQKQYELSNHLGNVQATVSDLPYMATFTQPDSDVPGVKYEPSLRSAYDYYPFGMLMPGRYVSDTTERHMTISRTGWSTILVDSCWPLGVMYANHIASGSATAVYANNTLSLSVPQESSISFAMQVAAGVENSFEFNVGKVNGGSGQGVLVTVLETIDNVPYVIGGGRLQVGNRQKITFRSTGNNISLVFPEHFTELELAMVCTKIPKSVQHTYLVDVSDQSKDKYRFGFNGQEKVNEIAGIGNHNTAQFWEYDTRLGRRWNLDPKPNVSLSNYSVLGNNPIIFKDLKGDTISVSLFDEQAYSNKRGDPDYVVGAMNHVKRQKNDGIYAVYGHGGWDGILDQNFTMMDLNTAEKVVGVLKNVAPGFDEDMNNKREITLIMYSCETGKGDNSIAKQISKVFTNITVIAPELMVGFYWDGKKNGDGFLRVQKEIKDPVTHEKKYKFGRFKVFKRGEHVQSLIYNKFNFKVNNTDTKKSKAIIRSTFQ